MREKNKKKEKVKKERRKWGDRKDGYYLKSLDPYYKFTPFIMKHRGDATNYFSDSFDTTNAEAFLRKKRRTGYKGMGILHLFIAGYIRVVSQRPAINRFISGQRIYARKNIEVVMTIKRGMTSDSGESSLKVVFEPTDTIYDVYNKLNEEILKIKENEETNTDDVAEKLCKVPRVFLNMALRFINLLDYFGKLPQSLVNASPFHGSLVITDIGSLGIPTIYHHLYNFGNVPLFVAFGAKRQKYELQKDGTVVQRRYIEYAVTTDERICDGFYYAASLKHLKYYFMNPETLEVPPEKVIEDLRK